MFRKRKLLWLILITFSSVIFLGGIWTYALGGQAKITTVKLTDADTGGYIETDLDGNAPIDPVYNDGTGEKPMYQATIVYICPDEITIIEEGPPFPGVEPCQKVVQATFGAAWNLWLNWGWGWFYVAP